MAIIRQDKIIDWTAIGRDKFLRNQEAPALYDDPITNRDIRGGIEVVSRSGNIMPKAVTRDKLGDDALLVSMNLNISSADTIMVATGYDKSLNDYLYAVNWDGTNYYLRRFNTADLMSPYQDGYSVNLPADSARDLILAVTVLSDKVAVLVEKSDGKCSIYFYSFDLTYLSTISAPEFAYEDAAFSRNLDFDGQYFVHSILASARFNIKQLVNGSSVGINTGGTSYYQTFTSTALGGNLKKIGVKLKSTNGNSSVTIEIRNSSNSILWSQSFTVASGGTENWYYFTPNLAVSPSTVYRIAVYAGASGNTVDWITATGGAYSGGSLYDGAGTDQNKDATFDIYQDVPASWQGKICRFSITDYSFVDGFAYPGGYTQPKELMAYDKKFHYAFETAAKKITKFAIQDGLVVVASEQVTQEIMRGILNFNNFIFLVFNIGTSVVSVPVSI